MYNYGSLSRFIEKKDLSYRKLAKIKNNTTFNNTLSRTILDGLDRYDIEGLPETISKRVVKEAFLYRAGAIFFEKSGNLLALPGAPTEGININGDCKYGYVWGRNGFNEKVSLYIPGGDLSDLLRNTIGSIAGKGYNAVFVRENYICFPFINNCIDYAEAIADSMRTLDVVRANLKQPFIIVAEQSVVESVKRFMSKRNENLEFIIDSGVFPVDKIKLLPFDSNSVTLKDTVDLIEWYWNQFYTLCGVNTNANPDKKAELTSFEINANNEIIQLQADKTIDCLNEHFDNVNKIFGTHIKAVKKDLVSVSDKQEGFTDDDNQEENDDDQE